MLSWKCVLIAYSITLLYKVTAYSTIHREVPGFLNRTNLPKRINYQKRNASTSTNNGESPWRCHFPALSQSGLIYLDNAATTQKPYCVIEAITNYYASPCSNVHRSQYQLATAVSNQYEDARTAIAKFINAPSARNIIFTSGATDSINLVANAWGYTHIRPGDTVLVPLSEHNSNILPWKLLEQKNNSNVHFVKLNTDGTLDLDDYKRQLSTGKVRLISIAHASNVLGVVQDLKSIIATAHEHGALVLVDACQTLAHVNIDVQQLNCDFLVASGHKVYGPTGIGFLYAKQEVIEHMSPYKGGGGMVKNLDTSGYELEDIPHRFESGTPPVAQAIGLSKALEFISHIGLSNVRMKGVLSNPHQIASHERMLLSHLDTQLRNLATVHSPPIKHEHVPIVTFNIAGQSPYDLAQLLSTRNIAIRAGR
uniref:cysteine desulfurase n=1 Tax=Babesia bovis TaxID=5865 RepID=A7AVV5_BABBO|eukprot:XP_001609499.1 cysteine desulfurase [Babesia bovis T2Bo]